MSRVLLLLVLVALSGCRKRATNLDELAASLKARGLTVETLTPSADEVALLEKFAQEIDTRPTTVVAFRKLSLDGVEVGVEQHRTADDAAAAVREKLDQETKKEQRDATQHRAYFPSRFWARGPFAFRLDHWTVDAAPGGKLDLGSYRPVDVDPATEQRIKAAIDAVKVSVF